MAVKSDLSCCRRGRAEVFWWSYGAVIVPPESTVTYRQLIPRITAAFRSEVHFRAALLHGVPSIVSPDLLEALASLGQGDKIVLASLNFPAASTCRGPGRPLLVRADGHSIPDLLEAIVKLLPLAPKSEVMTPIDF